jgi:predicted O-methyltransferase YrrM
MKLENHFQGPMIDHIRDLVAVEDDVLEEARRRAQQAGLPPIEVAPEDGALLAALVRAIDARLVVEIGTLFGYSAIWMARALPEGGQLFTIELEARHAELARHNLALAGLTERVTVLQGPADEMLARLAGPVDLVFIDADKEGYPGYLAWARQALRPGGLVLGDNAFMQGRLADPGNEEPGVAAMRRFLESLASDPVWVSAMIPTLEGMALGVRT